MAKEAQSGPSDAHGLAINQRYELLPGKRLPEFDSPQAEAFEVRSLRAAHQRFFALLCRSGSLPRINLLEEFARGGRGPMVRPVEWQAVSWPPEGTRRMAIVFPRPAGQRVPLDGKNKFPPWKSDAVLRHVIRPQLPLLRDLSERGLMHRAIRAENLFYTGDDGLDVMLGECVSGPPGLSQHTIYETIENGMAQPEGRSEGAPADDLYAFAVLLVVLLNGGNPCAGMSDAEIIEAKLKLGSHGALAGRAKMPVKMMEPLRGLLCDDPKQRWGVQDLELWADGRTQTPKQPALPRKATRPIRFAGTDYWNTRSLAHAMANDWPHAVQLMQGEELSEWLRRNLSDEERADDIASVLRLDSEVSNDAGTADDLKLAQVLLILDPQAPLRYQDLAVHVDALGSALVYSWDDETWFQHFDMIMNGRLPVYWFDRQTVPEAELAALRRRIEEADAAYGQSTMGKGVERCLYVLAAGCACKCKLLDKSYVTGIGELIPALEHLAQQGIPADDPVDRHVAAFCAAQMKRVPDSLLESLTKGDPPQRSLAMARLLAEVQRTTGPAQLPALTGWLASRLVTLIESYHYRPYRKQLAVDTTSVVARGVIGELCVLFDTQAVKRADEQGVRNAAIQHSQAESEIVWLQQGGLTNPANVMRGSRQAATAIATVASGLVLVVLAMVRML